MTMACDRSDASRIASGGSSPLSEKSVSGGLVAPDAAERDTLLLGDFSEHLGGLRIKLIAQEVGHRQPAL